jgi:hypothetical protein
MIDAGAVPVSIAMTGSGTALSARTFAVADPAAKRIWRIEGTQSTTQAVARGFLRGLIGLGLYDARSSELPTGVDRVLTRGGRTIAYDSSSATLYELVRDKPRVLARNVAPNAFTLTSAGVAYLSDGVLHTQQ